MQDSGASEVTTRPSDVFFAPGQGRKGYCRACAFAYVRDLKQRLEDGYSARQVAVWLSTFGVSISRAVIYRHKRHLADPPALTPALSPEERKARHNAANQAWRARNHEDLLATRRAQYAADKDNNDEKRRTWYVGYVTGDPERARARNFASQSNYRVKKKYGDRGQVTTEGALQISGPCVYCGTDEEVGYDHFVPLSKGGANTVDNVVRACRACNSKKGVKMPANFLAQRDLRTPTLSRASLAMELFLRPLADAACHLHAAEDWKVLGARFLSA
jgi:5-methylcytosine-specific restriction endonuclease McrA